jgi:hypothetical protein
MSDRAGSYPESVMPRTKKMATAVPSEKATSTARRCKSTAYPGQTDLRRKYPTSAGDNILEAAESALRHKAVAMALAGDPVTMRYCLDELSAQRLRTAGLSLPEITTIEDLSKATSAILQAAAAGKITLQEAKGLAYLIGVHAQTMRSEELAKRIACLEQQGAVVDPKSGRRILGRRDQRLEPATAVRSRSFTIECRDGEEDSERTNKLCQKIEMEHGPLDPKSDHIVILTVFGDEKFVTDEIIVRALT